MKFDTLFFYEEQLFMSFFQANEKDRKQFIEKKNDFIKFNYPLKKEKLILFFCIE